MSTFKGVVDGQYQWLLLGLHWLTYQKNFRMLELRIIETAGFYVADLI